jgi:predicted Rossmann-fold nucleotide-binding protein
MQARLWVDCRDDSLYSDAVQQILVHVFRRYDVQKPQVSAIAVGPQQVAIKSAEEPQRWVLVAGTGVTRSFSPELEALSRSLGEGLVAKRCGLVTGGWPGVDEWVARSFAESASKSQVPLEDTLVQVIVRNEEPVFTAGQLVFVRKGDEEWDEPIRRANVVVLLGGVGGTRETGKRALKLGRPVLPIADSGGDAKAFYVDMLKQWDNLDWMGLTEREFQRLGRPASAAIDAALELALKVKTK